LLALRKKNIELKATYGLVLEKTIG